MRLETLVLIRTADGRPSNLAWAVAFPEGLPPTTVPVHPTQLYEALFLLSTAALLLSWRRRHLNNRFVGSYLLLTSSLRFAIEFVRVNERVLGALAVAHLRH